MTDAERECRNDAAEEEDRWRREAEDAAHMDDEGELVESIECANFRCDRCFDSECQCPCHVGVPF